MGEIKPEEINVTDPTKKRMKIEFEKPVGCLINPTAGEMLSECFHKYDLYPPRFGECAHCLKANKHKKFSYDKTGRKLNVQVKTEKGWENPPQEFKTL